VNTHESEIEGEEDGARKQESFEERESEKENAQIAEIKFMYEEKEYLCNDNCVEIY
jgi:hypothetical protein